MNLCIVPLLTLVPLGAEWVARRHGAYWLTSPDDSGLDVGKEHAARVNCAKWCSWKSHANTYGGVG